MPPAWLPLAALTFILVASALRVWSVERTEKVKAFGFGRKASIQKLAERHWRLAVLVAFSAAALSWFAPETEAMLGRVDTGGVWLRWTSAGVFAFSVLVVAIAQLQMGGSWRVGVPAEGPGALVTHGLFAWSRNPVFVGMIGAILALFLWSPHILTAALLAAMWTLTLVQVRIEEDALRETHGDAYEHYAAHVGRWFGRRSYHRC